MIFKVLTLFCFPWLVQAMESFPDLGPDSCYDLLGVKTTATATEINRSFLKAMKVYHPDRPNGDSRLAQNLSACRDILLDPSKRRNYDTWLTSGKSDFMSLVRPRETDEQIVTKILRGMFTEISEALQTQPSTYETTEDLAFLGRTLIIYRQRSLPSASLSISHLERLLQMTLSDSTIYEQFPERVLFAMGAGVIKILKEISKHEPLHRNKSNELLASLKTKLESTIEQNRLTKEVAKNLWAYLTGYTYAPPHLSSPRPGTPSGPSTECQHQLYADYVDAEGNRWSIPISITIKIGQ